MNRKIGIILSTLLLSSCVSIGDSLVSVQGVVQDERGNAYSNCLVSLYLSGENKPLHSRRIEEDALKKRGVATSFQVPGKWVDSFVHIECDGAAENFVSERLGRDRPIPVELGTITLSRTQE